MNKRLISLMAAALALLSASGQLSFTGGSSELYPPIEAPESTRDFKIYVVYDTQDVSMHYLSETGERPKVCTFESYPTEIDGVQWNGYEARLNQVIPNRGYIINDNVRFWVVNYSDYLMELNDMFINDDRPCEMLNFRVDGMVPPIPYRTSVNGSTKYLDRQIELSFNTLEWNDNDSCWQEVPKTETFESLNSIIVNPPLCNTEFSLSGDYYLRQWGLDEETIDGVYYRTQAVKSGTTAVQEVRESTNEQERSLDSKLGGSSPVHIIFTGYPTDAVVYRVWEIATDPDFENVILQFNQDVVDYTFTEYGTYYVRYMVANETGTCQYYSDETYTVEVRESKLVCPNVFSPGSTEGVNDEWRVSYKSLVEFHCWIFNRWGTLVYESTDPGQGWDGKYHGKLVDTGVYYYVVTALGADGVKYKRRGDITIMRYKKGAAGTSNGGDTGGY